LLIDVSAPMIEVVCAHIWARESASSH